MTEKKFYHWHGICVGKIHAKTSQKKILFFLPEYAWHQNHLIIVWTRARHFRQFQIDNLRHAGVGLFVASMRCRHKQANDKTTKL